MHILIIEDEKKLANLLKEGLGEAGISVEIANTGQIGITKALNTDFNLIIIDILLPDINGFDVCKKIRSKDEETPIIMLTALGTTDDKLNGFDSGANDYLVKPFEFRELLARIKAQTKNKSKNKYESIIKAGDLQLDTDSKTCIRGDKKFKLTVKEYTLLEYFIKNKNRVISRSELADKVWNIRFDTGTNIVDVYVNYLRKKIDKDFDNKLIQTHVGIGYIFNNPENENQK
jgi:two-component system, OmpR family, copper resistance phosphate regulon response regulator CusR